MSSSVENKVAGTGVGLLPVLARRTDTVDGALARAFPYLDRRKRMAITNEAGWVAGTTAADLADLGVGPGLEGRGVAAVLHSSHMGQVASRELRNNTRGVLERVESGEEVTITVDGKPVAVLVPLSHRRRTLTREEFLARFDHHQADAGLTKELAEMLPDTTDDLKWP